MTVSAPKPGPRVLIMLNEEGTIMSVHTNDHVQVLCVQRTPQGLGRAPKYVRQAPAGLSGNYALGPGFDNLVRQYFVNRVFNLFGR